MPRAEPSRPIGPEPAKPFVRNRSTCNMTWPFALTITNYDGPSIAARDKSGHEPQR